MMFDKVYKLIKLSEYPELSEHERFKECILCMEAPGHPECGLFTYIVPLDLYIEITKELIPGVIVNIKNLNGNITM